jgi:hypothetical protein
MRLQTRLKTRAGYSRQNTHGRIHEHAVERCGDEELAQQRHGHPRTAACGNATDDGS